MSTVTAQRTIKPGTKVERHFALTRAAVNEDGRTVEISWASEAEVQRYWGIEILDCSPGAVRLGRIQAGMNLVCDHKLSDVVGVTRSVTFGDDKVIRSPFKFSRSARGQEVFQDVVDEIRTGVSCGYVIHEAQLVGERDGVDIWRVTDWEPYEASLTAAPADISVGTNRSLNADGKEEPSPIVLLNQPQERSMTTAAPQQQQTPAAAPAAPALNISQAVAERETEMRTQLREMSAIADTFHSDKIDARGLLKQTLDKGEGVEQLRGYIMNAMAASQTTQVTDLGMSKREAKRFSVLAGVRAMTDRDWKHAGFERECQAEILKRAGVPEAPHGGFYIPTDVMTLQRDLTVGTPTAGGNIVGTELRPQNFIDLLRARTVVARLGATMLPGLVGNVTIPKQTGSATGYWLANEAAAITESQQTFGQLPLSPKHIGCYTEISRLLMLQSTPAADLLVMNDILAVIGRGVDLAALEGSGAGGQPTGIANTAGIGSVTGTSLAYAGIIEFQTDVAAGNALTTDCAYVTTPAVAGLLMGRQRFTSTDTPLWTGNVLDGQLGGMTATTSTQVTAASMTFGDFAQVVIGEWGLLEIALNPYANFPAGITGIRGIQALDVGIRQAAAFSRGASIT